MKDVILPTYNRSLFIDSSNVEEIKRWNATGIIDGVTTNQLIMLKDGMKIKDYERVIKNICREMKNKPVSVELTDSTASAESMIVEAERINSIASNIVVKVPMVPESTKTLFVIYELAKRNIAVNVTLMMTYEQMLASALSVRHCKRLSFISLLWGRSIEDHGAYRTRSDFMAQYPDVGLETEVNSHPKLLVSEVARFLREGSYDNPKIIVGSIRTASMVGEAFAAGGHIVTVAPKTLKALLFSQRTIETAKQFDEAWKQLQSKK